MQDWDVQTVANSGVEVPWYGIGLLTAISVSIAVAMMYAALRHRQSRPFRYSTAGLLATVVCIGFAAAAYGNHAGVWLSLLFLAISIPAANMVAVGGLVLFAIWQQRRRRAAGATNVQPYVGPVAQHPVDVVPDEDAVAQRLPVKRRNRGSGQ